MAHHCLLRSCAGLVVVLALWACAEPSLASAVYDNTSTPTVGSPLFDGYVYCPDSFFPFNTFNANEFMGDQAQLAGTDREVVEFDLMLSSAELTNLSALNLALYDLNAHTGLPDKQLWTTSIANVSVDGLTEVTFSVPHISVLTDFVWVASADSNIAGLATFDPPTVGSSPTFGPDHIDYYWDLDSSSRQWIGCTFEGSLVANFGAKIVAVPEPATLGLISFGCLLMSRKKRSAR